MNIGCPYCGKTNAGDNRSLEMKVKSRDCSGQTCTVIERRKCDICGKIYAVEMYYRFEYEVLCEATTDLQL